MDSNNIKDIREKIDSLDKQLVLTLLKREKLVTLAAKYKKKNNLPIYQPEREKILLKEKKKIALELNLKPEYVEKIFKLILNESKIVQKRLLMEK